MEPLSILHVVDSLERGGLERVVCDMALEQVRAGCRAGIFCIHREGPLAEEARSGGVVVSSGRKDQSGGPWPFLRLRREIFGGKWQIVHAHNLVPNYYAAVATRLAFKAPPVINSCHDMGTRLANARLRRLYTWSLRHTSRVAMVADEVFDRYVGAGLVEAGRAAVVYNGIRTDRFHVDDVRRSEARRALGIEPDAFVAGSVGRLVPLKNHALLLNSLARIRTEVPLARVVLIGAGVLDDELRRLAVDLGIEDIVVFAGERPEIHALLPAFDVFVLPSNTEGLSIALLEAACTGLAIVATDVGGNPRIVSHDLTGMLVPPGDVEAVSSALLRLAREPGFRQRLASAARDWALQNASLQRQCTAFASLYASALGRTA